VGAVEGGAVANLYAVLVARHRAQPNVKHKGLTNLPPLVVFQSDRVCSVYSYVLVTLTLWEYKTREYDVFIQLSSPSYWTVANHTASYRFQIKVI